MIGLDINVFLRLFVEDDPDQTARARRYVAAAVREDVCFVNPVVLAEFAWTLGRRLKRNRPDIARLVEQALSADDLEIAIATPPRARSTPFAAAARTSPIIIWLRSIRSAAAPRRSRLTKTR